MNIFKFIGRFLNSADELVATGEDAIKRYRRTAAIEGTDELFDIIKASNKKFSIDEFAAEVSQFKQRDEKLKTYLDEIDKLNEKEKKQG